MDEITEMKSEMRTVQDKYIYLPTEWLESLGLKKGDQAFLVFNPVEKRIEIYTQQFALQRMGIDGQGNTGTGQQSSGQQPEPIAVATQSDNPSSDSVSSK